MSKINYPTLDLFIYNYSRIPESARQKYENYWHDLDNQLQQTKIISQESSSNYKLYYQPQDKDKQIDISYLRKSIQDTYLLNYTSSQDRAIELSQITNLLNKLKDLAVLPQIEKLSPGRLSENGYLGKTWMISTWMDNNQKFSEGIADNIYCCLIGHKYQHQQVGQFLDAKVWEMWRDDTELRGIDKDSHVMIIVYPNEVKFAQAAKFYYQYWHELLLYKHKIIWAYQNGKKLKSQLSAQYDESLTNSTALLRKNLDELKNDLQNNTNALTAYVRNINLLETQQHTIEVNLRNYEKICEYKFQNVDFLENFSQIVKQKYQIQLEKDYLGLNPGLAILENVTSTIRGMVEIEQAKKDRNLSNTVAILGVGLATSQLASAVILAQKPPSKNIPFYQTTAFKSSFFAGIIASLFVWGIIFLIRYLQRNK